MSDSVLMVSARESLVEMLSHVKRGSNPFMFLRKKVGWPGPQESH